MGAAASSDAATPEQLRRDARAALARRSPPVAWASRPPTSSPRSTATADPRHRTSRLAKSSSALSEVCGWYPGTSIEFIPGSFLRGFSDEDIELMADMSAAANRHLNWNTPLVNKRRPTCTSAS